MVPVEKSRQNEKQINGKKEKKRILKKKKIHRNLILWVLKITQTEGDKFINDNNKPTNAPNTFLSNKKMLRSVAITMINDD